MKTFYVISLILGLTLTSCRAGADSGASSQVNTQTRLLPKISGWKMGDLLTSTKDSLSVAVHLVELTESQIFIVYSVADPNSVLAEKDLTIQASDVKGDIYYAESSILYNKEDHFQIRVAAMKLNALSRDFRVRLSTSKGFELPSLSVLTAVGPEENFPSIGFYSIHRYGYSDQNDVRVSVNPGLFKGDLVATSLAEGGMTEAQVIAANRIADKTMNIATPVPIEISETAKNLTNGKAIISDGTLRLESTSTKQVNYLYIVFLPDESPKAVLLD